MTAKSGTWTLSNLLRLDVVREEKYMAARPRITIIGMGFVGTSLALGLQRVRGPKSDFEIVGHDKDNSVAGAAKKMGAVDRTDWNLIGAIDQADLVFVATPVSAIRDTLAAIGRHLKAGAIVTDTGGTKSQVMRWAAETLPDHVHFIGGDPLLGREGAPADTASADVFAKTLYCLTPAPAADGDAVRILADFITAMGAQPYFVDPDEHDGLVAAVAHLPFFLATALLNAAAHSRSWPELQKMAGEDFRVTTSVVNTDPARWEGLVTTNAVALTRWIDAAISELQALRSVVTSDEPKDFAEALDDARTTRIKLTHAQQQEEDTGPMVDVGRDRFRQMIFGNFGQKRPKK